MAAVRDYGQPLADDERWLDDVDTVGVDETAFLAATGGEASAIGDYELVVRYWGEQGVVTTFVASSYLMSETGSSLLVTIGELVLNTGP